MKPFLDLPIAFPPGAYNYGKRSSGETHGVVLTKPHVVELILDMAGYSSAKDLASLRLLEPSCGTGAFLVPVARRLIRSALRSGHKPSNLGGCLVAFDIDRAHVESAKAAVHKILLEEGVRAGTAESLAEQWIQQGDFLLASIEPRGFDAIVGNPPYIRIEQLSPEIQSAYRERYESLFDRADIYVAFIERSLDLLGPRGTLSFICADRWTQNRYGAPLRRIIADSFCVKAYVDLHQASPFESEVIAYPSIFSITPGQTKNVALARLAVADEAECKALSLGLNGGKPGNVDITNYSTWFQGEEPWVLSPPEHLKTLRELEARFEPLEADGKTRVRIGVATGNDATYIVDAKADIEPSRLVPLVMRADIQNGEVTDGKRFVINTFDARGQVIQLADYPRLQRYIETHGVDVKKRHVAQKNPDSWFRTIDRVYPELVMVPKLLIPDIAGSNEVALDKGKFHPHHNLYFVTSDVWELGVLGGLLSSKVALFFIWSYATKMRGSYLRFQAQYLRRIRVPRPSDIPPQLAKEICAAFAGRNFKKLDSLALQAYGLKSLPAFDFVDTRR